MLLAFYRGRKRFFNRFVSWWTRGPYSHVEAVFGDPSRPVLCGSSSFMDGGVRLKVINLDPAHWDLLEAPAIDGERVRAGFDRMIGTPYDMLGLLSTSIPLVPHLERGQFCNEVVGHLGGLGESWRMNPNGFARVCEWLPGSRWLSWEEIKNVSDTRNCARRV